MLSIPNRFESNEWKILGGIFFSVSNSFLKMHQFKSENFRFIRFFTVLWFIAPLSFTVDDSDWKIFVASPHQTTHFQIKFVNNFHINVLIYLWIAFYKKNAKIKKYRSETVFFFHHSSYVKIIKFIFFYNHRSGFTVERYDLHSRIWSNQCQNSITICHRFLYRDLISLPSPLAISINTLIVSKNVKEIGQKKKSIPSFAYLSHQITNRHNTNSWKRENPVRNWKDSRMSRS